MGSSAAILDRGGRPVLIATGVALLVAAAGAAQIRTYGSTREYMARGSLPRLHLEEIERHFPGTVTMTMLYDGTAAERQVARRAAPHAGPERRAGA